MRNALLSETNLTAVEEQPVKLDKTIWSVAGGKGGTGKSVIAANLGIGMAVMGYDVILIDGDFGVPDLHNYLLINRPKYTLDDFILKKTKSLSDVIIDTPLDNLRFISGAVNLIGIANMPHARKKKIIRHINKLEADIIIVDLGAGISYNTIDFFNISSSGIVVSNPEPNANQDAYFFLKNALYRKMIAYLKTQESFKYALSEFIQRNAKETFNFPEFEKFLKNSSSLLHQKFENFLKNFSPHLIMNKIRTLNQDREGPYFISLVKSFLNIDMHYLGGIKFDTRIILSSEKICPFIFQFSGAKITRKLFSILSILNQHEQPNHSVNTFKEFKELIKQQKKVWI